MREPIIRNVISFFQNIYLRYPDLDYQLKIKTINIRELIEEFLKNYSHDIFLKWFDEEMKRVFGLDVFSNAFPKSRGYKIYKGEIVEALLLRLENINECSHVAFKEFLNTDEFKLIKANVSRKKKYYADYRDFVDAVVLPHSYIDRMYSLKYAQHFYSEQELNAYKIKWLKKSFEPQNTSVLTEKDAGQIGH